MGIPMGIPTGFLWEWDGNGNGNSIPTATVLVAQPGGTYVYTKGTDPSDIRFLCVSTDTNIALIIDYNLKLMFFLLNY